jgi:hypothetical protein
MPIVPPLKGGRRARVAEIRRNERVDVLEGLVHEYRHAA